MSNELRILIAEDEEPVREFLRAALIELGLEDVHVRDDGRAALEALSELEPDILIADLVMPRLGGEALVREALALDPDVTVIVTTGKGTLEGAIHLLTHGVFDFITKPISLEVLRASLSRAAERASARIEIEGAREVLEALMAALESKDDYLLGHGKRVSLMARRLAGLAGWPRHAIRVLEYAALVHDVGKIGVPESILGKPSALEPEELEIIRRHPVFSRDIVQPVFYLAEGLPYIYHHHERIDGEGYPDGLAGDAIPEGARIIAVCDTFDAMTSRRAYRPGLPEERVLEVLRQERGKQLDGHLVDLFCENFDTIRVTESTPEQLELACV